MFSGISIICFAASYSVALALEISRLLFRSGIRGALLMGFAAAGLVAQTWYLAVQAAATPRGALPISNWFHWFLMAAWVLAVVYLYLSFYHPRNPIGLFLLPLVLVLIGFGYALRDEAAPPRTQAAAVWLWIHAGALLLGTVTVLLGFAAGAMYLVQSWRLKHKQVSARLRLPSLEWLEKVNGRSLVVSLLLVAIGVLAGLIRNADLLRRAGGGIPWSDPVVWSSTLLLGWLIAAVLFHAFYRPSRQGRKVAYLTVASFLFLAIVLGVVLLAPSNHPTQRAGANGQIPMSNDRGRKSAVSDGSMVIGHWSFVPAPTRSGSFMGEVS